MCLEKDVKPKTSQRSVERWVKEIKEIQRSKRPKDQKDQGTKMQDQTRQRAGVGAGVGALAVMLKLIFVSDVAAGDLA